MNVNCGIETKKKSDSFPHISSLTNLLQSIEKRGLAYYAACAADVQKFCANIEQFFDGRHDVFGNVKTSPEPLPPGLIIR